MIEYIKLIPFRKIFSSIFQLIGVLLSLIKVGEYFFGDQEWFKKTADFSFPIFLFILIILIVRARPRFTISKRIIGTDVDIEIKIKDIFSSNKAIIIGCNTTFDISVRKNIIDAKSIQGQYLRQYFEEEVELEELVEQELRKLSPSNITQQLKNINEYKIGTTIAVGKKRKAYLVAIAKLNAYNTAETDDNSFLGSLPKMWSEIRSKGNMENLDCPILGSGFARLNIKRQQLLIELIRSFIVATRDGKLTEKITFYISHGDFKKGHINMKELKQLLEYECTQFYTPSVGAVAPKGTPI